jgi:hypothetical protein
MGANQENLQAMMEAYPGRMEANQGKLETNKQKGEARAEHYKCVPHTEATCLLTTLQGQASSVLHGVPKGATCEETGGM